MSLISVAGLTFSYEGSYDNIFENVSFQIDTDWKLGFTGRNGRGKTTFLNLLLGKYEYEGTIAASVEFDYFPFPVEDMSRETWQVAMEVNPLCELWQLQRELNLLEVDEDVLYRPFATLSHGERTKVLLAVLFLRENAFLLIDEPTNHLDVEARRVLGQYLKRKKGFLLVSHDRQLLDTCVDHILSINKTEIQIQKGNFSSWYENKERQDQYEMAENERLKKDIRRLTAAARQSKAWAEKVEAGKIGYDPVKDTDRTKDTRAYLGEQSRRMQQRRKNLEHRQNIAIEEKSALLKNIETADELKLFPQKHHKKELVVCEGLTLRYGTVDHQPAGHQPVDDQHVGHLPVNHQPVDDPEGMPSKVIVSDWGLTVCQGERIALQGRNGCGKSSVLKALLTVASANRSGDYLDGDDLDKDFSGEDSSNIRKAGIHDVLQIQGKIELASKLKISYVSQDTSDLRGKLSEYAARYGVEEHIFKALLRKLDFSRIQLEKPMEDYSEGQKKKVLIARSLCEQAHLYIWDEPLNYIDVLSRMQIEQLILTYQPTLLFVEHDQAFTDKIVTRIVRM